MVKTNIKRFSRAKLTETGEPIEPTVPTTEEPKLVQETEQVFLEEASMPSPASGGDWDDSFLDELREREEPMQQVTPPASPPKKRGRPKKKASGKGEAQPVDQLAIPDFDASFFSNTGSEILGAERRQRLVKIAQYKKLFSNSDAVRKFTIKKNASVSELDDYLAELEVIVSLDSVENMLTDMILQAIKILEGASAKTDNFDFTGTSEALKNNDMFYQLCKELWLKHGSFAKIPPELRMGLLLVTTMTIQMNKNRKTKEVSYQLNQPYTNPFGSV